MDEIIDIVTSNGNPTGKSAPKSIVHQKGYYHNTAHVWFYTTNGKILLSQRSSKKILYPLLWDVSVAGHIDAGETIKQGAIREIKEEIGLEVSEDDLNKIGVFNCFKSYDNGILDNEFHHTFISNLKVSLSQLTIQAEEVEALKLVSTNNFKRLLNTIGNNNNHFVASNKSYYETVLHHIEQAMTRK
ncbi:NUDIX domain-containing protein [Oceanihabitans sp. IOP_32]|uniref:NUDIX hydrolase n=1 Tax=Oceanihabitans sp. IOP_32 TaxID=2529032 RepID=UPI001293F471|nr:NUDIX domain-containing protein [Oceanihabitans sp. IOP_32]QFZ53488.1 NUDIX domain-containing protein [Oceanihabitans sp. IOP_32]